MYRVKIIGSGSIGNHLAYGCRCKGWDVLMCDTDEGALIRTRESIYPKRYGKWDNEIELTKCSEAPDGPFDLIIIGTPPDTHIPLALHALKKFPPRVLLIEKPLCEPSLANLSELQDAVSFKETVITVGYNHTLTKNTIRAEDLLSQNLVGEPLTISSYFREHWGGIFNAHPWLDGPKDSYLGFWQRGGGASGEHSHAINIWQHFAHILGAGRIVEVRAMLDMVDDGKVRYDRICQIHVKTESGLVGLVVQDVLTEPSQKCVRIQGSSGFLEWYVNSDKENDSIRFLDEKSVVKEELIKKSRPDDFKGELDHIEMLLNDKISSSPILLERGMDTMLVVAAAHLSNQESRSVSINYQAGYGPMALELM